jgi:hypothetical protein
MIKISFLYVREDYLMYGILKLVLGLLNILIGSINCWLLLMILIMILLFVHVLIINLGFLRIKDRFRYVNMKLRRVSLLVFILARYLFFILI